VREVGGDDVEIAHAAAAADVRRLLGEQAAEDAFHRAHQAAVDAVDISCDRSAPELAAWCLVHRAVGAVENGRRHRDVARLQLDQTHAALAGYGDGGIGSAEIDRAETGCSHGTHRGGGSDEGARF